MYLLVIGICPIFPCECVNSKCFKKKTPLSPNHEADSIAVTLCSCYDPLVWCKTIAVRTANSSLIFFVNEVHSAWKSSAVAMAQKHCAFNLILQTFGIWSIKIMLMSSGVWADTRSNDVNFTLRNAREIPEKQKKWQIVYYTSDQRHEMRKEIENHYLRFKSKNYFRLFLVAKATW